MADLTEITIKLPVDLVRDAEEFGLLTSEELAHMLRDVVDQRVNDLVNEEIHAYRAEKKAKQSGNQ